MDNLIAIVDARAMLTRTLRSLLAAGGSGDIVLTVTVKNGQIRYTSAETHTIRTVRHRPHLPQSYQPNAKPTFGQHDRP
jgi:hypothetical protein